MFVVVSDTHSTGGHHLADRTLDAVREAGLVVHTGDSMRRSVLDAFIGEADSFLAVYGNNDDSEIHDRIPAVRNVICGGVEFAVMHTRRDRNTALSVFGRERGADVVVFGHGHRPGFHGTGPIPLLNPGSHAQLRDNHKMHVEPEELSDGDLRGRLVTVNGETFETFHIVPDE